MFNVATCHVFLLRVIFIFRIYCGFSLSTVPVPGVTMSGSSKIRKVHEIDDSILSIHML